MTTNPKQTPEEREAYLGNEKTYLEARLRKLKKDGHREKELIDWYIKVAEDNLAKIKEELKSLGSK